jgi:hypothetical protein
MESFKREIFEQLGNLFYALASDQRVSAMASGELKMLLKKDWLTERGERSEDRVSEAAHLIGLSIDALQNEKVPAEVAFGNFAGFYTKHREQFSYALKQKILETSEAIIKIFSTSRQRNIHLEELKKLLELSRQGTEVGL